VADEVSLEYISKPDLNSIAKAPLAFSGQSLAGSTRTMKGHGRAMPRISQP
jgi:hypothetical protein